MWPNYSLEDSIKQVKGAYYGLEPTKQRDEKRTLGIRDKQLLYRKAKGRCENPACNKKIEFDEMEVGHKKAHSKGGRTTYENSVCLCHRCNKLQGTDDWATFLKKYGVKTASPKPGIKKTTKPKTKKPSKAKTIKPKKEEDEFTRMQKEVQRMFRGL
jgi:hypothetical protein